MDKAYIVTKGMYSDYQVMGVFSTWDKAYALEQAIGQYYGLSDNGSITEYQLDPDIKTWEFWRVYMWRDGSLVTDHAPERMLRANGDYLKGPYLGFLGSRLWMKLQVGVETAEHAIKKANEVRCQLIGLDLWPPDDGPLLTQEIIQQSAVERNSLARWLNVALQERLGVGNG